jgi:hypothetical protein
MPDQESEKFSCGRKRIRRWKPSHPLARLTAWWISQCQQQSARFWTGTHADRRGMGVTDCSHNVGYGMPALGGEADLSRISAKVRVWTQNGRSSDDRTTLVEAPATQLSPFLGLGDRSNATGIPTARGRGKRSAGLITRIIKVDFISCLVATFGLAAASNPLNS